MKTSVNMVRKMGNFNVTQRTKDSFFNATELLKNWNDNNPKPSRDLDNFWKSTNLTEFMSEVAQYEVDFKSVDFTELKQRLTEIKKGKYGGTWMHPILFLKFAMYLNPRFEYTVIKFVYDNLIAFRNDAGDNYIGLSNAVQKLKGCDYSQMAKGLNWIVFNRHKKSIRQEATQEQLKELNELQKKFAFAIDMGYINSFDKLVYEMRRMYNQKYLIK